MRFRSKATGTRAAERARERWSMPADRERWRHAEQPPFFETVWDIAWVVGIIVAYVVVIGIAVFGRKFL